jgi:hypothetical protein
LRPFHAEVEIYTDCTDPSKPIYHDLHRLARAWPNYTGYLDSTPIESWTEKKRLWYWAVLKAKARGKLYEAENGEKASVTTKAKKSKKAVTTKDYIRFQPHLQKYESNAAKQKAYRARHAVTTKG